MRKAQFIIGVILFAGIILLGGLSTSPSQALVQQPTGSIPTVTGTPSGPTIRVDQSLLTGIKVYAGPSSFDYPAIGVLMANETAPALGRARGREEWILIHYPGVPGSTGWVWGLQVGLSPGARLPLMEIPPTPTPFATPTLPPQLEEAFIGQQTATRLPTFTLPAPIEEPVFTDETENQPRGVPAGLLIVSLALFGFFGAVISYLRGR